MGHNKVQNRIVYISEIITLFNFLMLKEARKGSLLKMACKDILMGMTLEINVHGVHKQTYADI